MSKIIVPIEMPDSCSECYFRSKAEELIVDCGSYRKISRCLLAPNDMEDPWRDIHWQIEHRESWCPLEPFTTENEESL